MFKNYMKHVSGPVPQTEKLPGSPQVKNNAGGFVFQITDMSRLERFLVLGSTSNTYYTSARDLTKQNLDCLDRLIKDGKGPQVVRLVTDLSVEGRTPSNDPALLVLAKCSAAPDETTRKLALSALNQVARTGTHILHFVHYMTQFRGWGRANRRAIAEWFNSKPERQLAYQMLKYQSRDGYAQRDLLRLAHPKPATATYNSLYKWATKGWDATPDEGHYDQGLALIWAFEKAKKATSEDEIVHLIRDFDLPREAIPTQWLNSAKVWEALLVKMPLEATIRNLGTMSKIGLLTPLSEASHTVRERLTNTEALQKARIHPIKVLSALRTYGAGHGVRSNASWTTVPEVVGALEEAFYKSFKFVEPANKNTLLALDVSGSMGWGEIAGVPNLTPREATAALSLVTVATEPKVHIMGFSTTFMPLAINKGMSIQSATSAISGLPFQGTDCSLPMQWAKQERVPVDTFVVYTDNETWAGRIHPNVALADYRQAMGIDARLVVVGMTATEFSIADPTDPGMLDVVGFDAATPSFISKFSAGTLL